MRRLLWIGFTFAAVVGSSVAAQASVDGLLNDWGITIKGDHLVYTGYGSAAYNETANVMWNGTADIGGRTVAYQIEDSNDYSNNYLVSPLWGGQNYDAEALLVSMVGADLHIAIATGQRPDNLGIARFYAPGDISIIKGAGADRKVWGIEIGGGPGGQNPFYTNNLKISGGADGTTYTIDGNGYTQWSDPASDLQEAGSIWLTDGSMSPTINSAYDWQTGIANSGDPRPPTQLIGGTQLLGQADYAFNFGVDPLKKMKDDPLQTTGYGFGEHAFIELVVNNYANVFKDSLDGATVRWSPVCGNDLLSLEVTLPPKEGQVPEPASMVVWTLLIAVVGWAAWRRKRA